MSGKRRSRWGQPRRGRRNGPSGTPPSGRSAADGSDDIPPPRKAAEWGVGPVRIGSRDQRHVTARHNRHSRTEGKRLFPHDWSDEKILAAVELTAAEPMNVVTSGQFVIRYREIDRVVVRVTSSHFPLDAEGEFESGAPHSGDWVTINKLGKRVKMPLDRSVLWE